MTRADGHPERDRARHDEDRPLAARAPDRIALWIAVAEGILVAVLHDVTRWTVIIVAIPLILLYGLWGRNTSSDTARQITWIAGASQALAVLFVLLAAIIGIFVIAFVVLAAIIAIAFFFVDRR